MGGIEILVPIALNNAFNLLKQATTLRNTLLAGVASKMSAAAADNAAVYEAGMAARAVVSAGASDALCKAAHVRAGLE